MRITPAIFDAFLKCATKCHLRSLGEIGSGNEYAEWVRDRDESYHSEAALRMQEAVPKTERVVAPHATENLKAAKWRLAVDLLAQTPDRSADCQTHEPGPNEGSGGLAGPRSEQLLESRLQAVERVPSEGRGKPAQFVPIRFVFRNKLTKDDRLLLAFDVLVLSRALGREVSLGKIIHGDDHATLKVKTSALTGEARKRLDKVAALLSSPAPPDLVLNRHCAECEFQARCRKIAVEKDDLSLLAGMSEKERQRLRSKGIFTVTQLSYTFRPRRRLIRLCDKREKYHHSLKALAIREKKIHIVGSPELKIDGTPVYLDVEGLPDRDFYYLIGVRIGDGESSVQHSLWADSVEDEGKIWREFLALLETVEKPVLIHYGSYETTFLKRMGERHGPPCPGSGAAKSFSSPVNLLAFIYSRIYVPTFSNSLKHLGAFWGFKWSGALSSGIQSIVWREQWASLKNPQDRQALICYNTEDCCALGLLAKEIISLRRTTLGVEKASEHDVVDTTRIKREHPYGFRRNTFFFPEFDKINDAAYWDYQRERVYVRSNLRLRSGLKRSARPVRPPSPNKHIQCIGPANCPRCGSSEIRKHGRAKKSVYDLKFTHTGVKRWVVRYHFHEYHCLACGRTFYPPNRDWTSSKFGPGLIAFVIYQNIELRLPQETIDQGMNKLFGLRLAVGTTGHLKAKAATIYAETYTALLSKLQTGRLLHADETKVSVRGTDGFVWVFASMEEVAYVYAQTREGGLVQNFLQDFKGVLVSDFFAAYEDIDCPQQKCLVHLIRDFNDLLHKRPYDEELKQVAKAFANLVKPIIETIDRFGLKALFLKKHLCAVDRFYKELERVSLASEAALKCRERLVKNREGLFTFLRHDGVPWNNNNAEHAVKAFAMLRHVIKGVTSESGLRDYLVLLSVCETCKYMGVDFLDFLRSGEKDIHAFAESRRGRRRRTPPPSGLMPTSPGAPG